MTKGKSASQSYQMMDDIEHVLKLPDTYVGSVDPETANIHVFQDGRIVRKSITYIPGLYKIFDEIVVNARDHTVRDKKCKTIKVWINDDEISVWNDGSGIPVEVHEEHKIYIPEMIFSHLRSGGNYNQKGKIVGGKNGLGAKLANIFSTDFWIETIDGKNKKFYKQHTAENMSKIGKPEIKDSKGRPYTKITFRPDFPRFGVEGLTDDMKSLFRKRIYDIAACTNNNIKVYLDDELISVKSFQDYINMFYEKIPSEPIFEQVNDRWSVGVVYDPTSIQSQVSYVNGICTFQGGRHVDHVTDQVTKAVKRHIEAMKKYKDITVEKKYIKENLTFFIDSVIEDPAFSSQTKESLTTSVTKFGSRCEVSDNFIKSIIKSGIIDAVVNRAKAQEATQASKSDGKKKKSLKGLVKLDDAIWAGTRRSKQCYLILTEGDSAKTFAMSGLEIIGREKYGVFPLRGKLLNVRDAPQKTINNNEEIKNIKHIMGLRSDVKYDDSNIGTLRYGGIIILTDQDVDGSHIKGLVINMFHHFWPSLLKRDGFIMSMATPIVKVFKTSDKKKKNPRIFYTLSEYEDWIKSTDLKGWSKPKYYKGLGTSTNSEAKEAFSDFENRLISYIWSTYDKKKEVDLDEEDEDTDDEDTKSVESRNIKDKDNEPSHPDNVAINLAFAKEFADDRKNWLQNTYKRNNIIENDVREVPIHDFIDKDLIHFSHEDVFRSIPAIDGLKPSQRKIIHTCFLKGLDKHEMKVAQLSGYVSAETEYHHGEMSLQGAIVKLAQNFVGSNNVNLLKPNGNFGTRRRGGDDASSARYIFTELNEVTLKLFRREDDPIYDYVIEDGKKVEPEVYAPILPIVLINGASGIGTGFSTDVEKYNPVDIIRNIKRIMQGKKPDRMIPWYRGFTGTIRETSDKNKFEVYGKYELVNDSTVKITEIPVTVWSLDYRQKVLEKFSTDTNDIKVKECDKIVEDYIDTCGNNNINFEVTVSKKNMKNLIRSNNIDGKLKLIGKLSTTNMHLFNKDGVITKYKDPLNILSEYYEFRIDMYNKRKEYYIKLLTNQMNILKYKIRFIKYKISKKIKIENRRQAEVIEDLVDLKFPRLHTNPLVSDELKTYSYITDMKIFTLTKEKIEELEKQFEDKKEELDIYTNTPVEDIWLEEIKEFEKVYNKWLVELAEEEDDGPIKGKTNGKKSRAKKKSA